MKKLEMLERYMIIAKDIKKEFSYNKSTGKWCWYDRGDGWDDIIRQEQFDSFWLALKDAVAPYI